MILDKEITIKFNPANKKHYESLGYKFVYDGNITIPIEHLNKTSHTKINVKCDICGEEKRIAYRRYITNVERNGKYICNKHSYDRLKESNKKIFGDENPFKGIKFKENIKYYTDKSTETKHKKMILNHNILEIKDNGDTFIAKCDCGKNHNYEINSNAYLQRIKYKTILCTICNPIDSNIRSQAEKDIFNYILA